MALNISFRRAGRGRQEGQAAHLQLLTLILCLCKHLIPSQMFAKAQEVGTVVRSWPFINHKSNTRRTSAT